LRGAGGGNAHAVAARDGAAPAAGNAGNDFSGGELDVVLTAETGNDDAGLQRGLFRAASRLLLEVAVKRR
jgi:hypothetical protein